MSARCLIMTLTLVFTACTSEESVDTGAWAEFSVRIDFPLKDVGYEYTQTVRPFERPEIQGLQGAIVCGALDPGVSWISAGGTTGAEVTLTIALIDGTETIPLLTWAGKLAADPKPIPLSREEVKLAEAGLIRIREILVRPDPQYAVRYTLSGAAGAAARVEAAHYVRVATAKGICP